MGGANFCPVCGDIVGGWNNEPLSDCSCHLMGESLESQFERAYRRDLETELRDAQSEIDMWANTANNTVQSLINVTKKLVEAEMKLEVFREFWREYRKRYPDDEHHPDWDTPLERAERAVEPFMQEDGE